MEQTPNNYILKTISNCCISSEFQTKAWRTAQKWYQGGKKNECDIFQRHILEDVLGFKVNKTNTRINMVDYSLVNKCRPLTESGGFNYTEDFDGIWKAMGHVFYGNFKFICEAGGSQTRTMRETHHFLMSQHKYLLHNPDNNIYFVNILDGNQGYKYTYNNFEEGKASLFDIQLEEVFIDRVYIGDMKNFWSWYNKLNLVQ